MHADTLTQSCSCLLQVVSSDRRLEDYNQQTWPLHCGAWCPTTSAHSSPKLELDEHHLIRLLQVVSSDRRLEDYEPADLALALCRMVSYNIGHLAYLNAMRYNLRRVIFGGFFIRGHSYTMSTLSFAIRFWSKVQPAAAHCCPCAAQEGCLRQLTLLGLAVLACWRNKEHTRFGKRQWQPLQKALAELCCCCIFDAGASKLHVLPLACCCCVTQVCSHRAAQTRA